MNTSSKKQLLPFSQSKRLKQSGLKFFKKIRRDGKRFLQFINKEALLGGSLVLVIIIFLILPSPGYYQTLHLFRQSTEVPKIDLKVPLYAYPVNKTQTEPPPFSARSIVAMDADSSVVLYEKNSGLRLLPASTTKIMTALVVLDFYPLDQILTVGQIEKNGQSIDLLLGEQISVESLLYGLLVASGNDAAQVLAQNFYGGESAFVEAMNKKAQELNLTQTHFENPTGIDHPNHYTTALDLARLTVSALKNPVFAKIVATKQITIWNIGRQIPHHLYNVNQLVGKNGVLGVKTGWTQEAGECLVAYVRNVSQGIITVILGSQNRFGETEKLINWVFENFEWEEIEISNFY